MDNLCVINLATCLKTSRNYVESNNASLLLVKLQVVNFQHIFSKLTHRIDLFMQGLIFQHDHFAINLPISNKRNIVVLLLNRESSLIMGLTRLK